MKCPRCGKQEIRVLESRSAEGGQSVRRRRECMSCGYRFTTYERIEFMPIMVIKRDGSRESFNRNKILQGVMRACQKTQVSVKQMEELVNEIEEKLQLEDVQEVTTLRIGEMVLERLQRLSEVAYVRFASVYRKFQGIKDFVTELEQLERLETHLRRDLERPLRNSPPSESESTASPDWVGGIPQLLDQNDTSSNLSEIPK
ncbi:transcriptional repressor NrdR [Thermostichus sp. MS-CIW-21]|jgi:transcriptional repressor NrdR|uniref:Transcriptional repressor NrdR n=1 Tax=Synechococcus sp. (strain JA-3-3Ab) TaxID=321327 RepID=NRDR_SYNJA|nr:MULTISPECIES: transcriptional regulator NrdR [unclassified Synechococcus]Q2JVG1.1 RecName: Full=Transcriptional repressor NrdR [Synechococcus sp. JA-3-3Ab]ABC99278.1 transcriptional regulator, NrdR family [Synechococcus sp. JA-3-3Ab]PIK85381.1 NrdR family transcriptional regulator [Synechococcus sp. 63AY4M2]PIK89984.1 NrdR family transcriptional regulator [Synechococcus sp. 65AY6Li]PIK94426.1 NrdR family transcriptional regulator [Synechococcus sp. 60AY4M2]PIK96684.1 NrdR family transcript